MLQEKFHCKSMKQKAPACVVFFMLLQYRKLVGADKMASFGH